MAAYKMKLAVPGVIVIAAVISSGRGKKKCFKMVNRRKIRSGKGKGLVWSGSRGLGRHV